MIQINLLPWREQARKTRQTKFYGKLGISSFAAIVSILVLHMYYSHKITIQTNRNAYLSAEISSEQADFEVLDKKMKEKMAIDNELHFILSLRNNSYKAVKLLDELVRIVPDGVVLKKIVRTDDNVTIIGKANSNLEITLLMKHISESIIFSNPQLSIITGKENTTGEERLFQVTFSQQ